MRRYLIASFVTMLGAAALAAALSGAAVPGTDVPRWRLDPRAPRKFATADGPGRRVYGHVTVRRAGTYTLLLRGPDRTVRPVAEAVCEVPAEGRKVSLRIMLDATETAERPPAAGREEVTR